MTIAAHPVWPFDPNWSSSVQETLEWLTDILPSPTGSEQRRSLRRFPRRSIDFSILLEAEDRRLLDNLLCSYAAFDWYLPIWFDVTVSSATGTTTFIPCSPSNGIVVGTVVFIKGATPFDYRIAEVTSITGGGLTVSPALSTSVAAGSVIFPMTVGRLVEQPRISALTDGFETAEPQFMVTAPPAIFSPSAADAGLVTLYQGAWVLGLYPDWSDSFERGQQRMLNAIESKTGIPEQVDTAQRPFPIQRQTHILETASEHKQFYALLQFLMGRVVAVWMPTWMDDMRIVVPTTVSGLTVTVARCGFTLSGGPRPEREHIMIETISGQKYYRQITNSAIAGVNEVLLLDAAIGMVIQPKDILRVCFMSLMRLDHDTIEIEHLTDLAGISKCQLMFRAAPNTRVPTAGF